MTDVVSVHSGKGGTGKTFTAANLSLAFQHLGEDTVCIDTDVNSPNLAMQLGHMPGNFTLDDTLEGGINPIKAVHIHDSGLMFVPASLSLSSEDITTDRLNDMIENFSEFADRIVLDTSPGFGEKFQTTLDVSDRVVVVTNPEFQALKDAQKIVEEAKNRRKKIEGVILNKTAGIHEEATVDEVEDVVGHEVLFQIPHIERVQRSVHKGDPLASDRHSKIGNLFKELASDLTDREFNPPFHSKLVRAFRKLGVTV